MIIHNKLLAFNKRLIKEYGLETYSLILEKRPFEDVETNDKFSPIHELVEEGFLEFISLDIKHMSYIIYTIKFTDKAINEIKKAIFETCNEIIKDSLINKIP